MKLGGVKYKGALSTIRRTINNKDNYVEGFVLQSYLLLREKIHILFSADD